MFYCVLSSLFQRGKDHIILEMLLFHFAWCHKSLFYEHDSKMLNALFTIQLIDEVQNWAPPYIFSPTEYPVWIWNTPGHVT